MANVSIYDLSFKGKQKTAGWFSGETVTEIDSGLQITSKQVLPNEQIYRAVKKVPSDKTLPDDFIVQVFFTFDEQSFVRNKNAMKMMKKIRDNMDPNGFYSMPSLPYVHSFYPSSNQVNKATNTTYAILKPIPMWRHILDTSTRKFHWLMFNALSALFYLHKLGIVHRNISPESVYFVTDINDNPSIFIHNFSSACWLADQTDFTQIIKCNETAPLHDYIDPALLPKSRIQLQRMQQQAVSSLSDAEKKEISGKIEQLQNQINVRRDVLLKQNQGHLFQNDGQVKQLREALGKLKAKLRGVPPQDVRDNQATYAPFTDKSDVYAMGMIFYQIVTQGVGFDQQNVDPWEESIAINIGIPPDQQKMHATRLRKLDKSNIYDKIQELIAKMIHPNPSQRHDAESALHHLISIPSGNLEQKLPRFIPDGNTPFPQRAIMNHLGSQFQLEVPSIGQGTLAKVMTENWAAIDNNIRTRLPIADKYGSIREAKYGSIREAKSIGEKSSLWDFYQAGVDLTLVPLAVAMSNPFAAGVMIASSGLIKVHDRFQRKLSQRWGGR